MEKRDKPDEKKNRRTGIYCCKTKGRYGTIWIAHVTYSLWMEQLTHQMVEERKVPESPISSQKSLHILAIFVETFSWIHFLVDHMYLKNHELNKNHRNLTKFNKIYPNSGVIYLQNSTKPSFRLFATISRSSSFFLRTIRANGLTFVGNIFVETFS